MKFCTKYALSLSILAIGMLGSCKKDDAPASVPNYDVPATYNFAGSDSLKAKVILSMIGEMEIVINSGNTSGVAVSASKLKSMYANTGNFFTDTTFNGATLNLNTSGISLKSLTTPAAQAFVEAILDSIGVSSLSASPASNGVAGVSDKKTLLSINGVFWRQYFTKSIMGVVIGHQTTDVLLKDSLAASATTAKVHAWDNAFFLWNVPSNFPLNRAGVKYWGSYTSQVDSGLIKPVVNLTGVNANTTLLTGFTTGRAASANNDNTRAQAQVTAITAMYEKMTAAAILHEMNEAKADLAAGASAASVCGKLSEALGFAMALKYNTQRKTVTDAQINGIIAQFGTNLYTVTPAQIDAIANAVSTLYGWESVKSYL